MENEIEISKPEQSTEVTTLNQAQVTQLESMLTPQTYSLEEWAAYRAKLLQRESEIMKGVAENYGEITEEDEVSLSLNRQEADFVVEMLSKKFDNCAWYYKSLQSKIEVANAVVAKFEENLNRHKKRMLEVMQYLKIDKIEGETMRVSVCKNSQDTVIVEDPSKVPHMFCKAKVEISIKFDPSDKVVRAHWEKIIQDNVGNADFKGTITIEPDNSLLKEACRDTVGPNGEIEQGAEVDGVTIFRGVHLRISEIAKKVKKTAKKLASKE